MCVGSDSGAVASATIAKGGREYFSDDGSREYVEGGATGGGTTPSGRDQIAEDE